MKKTALIMFTALIACAATAQSGTDEQALAKVVSTMETGWVQKNGEMFSSVFADNHDFVVWNGYYFPNATQKGTAIAHQGLFDGVFKTFDIKLKVDKIRFIRPDIALLHVLGGGYQKGQPVPENPTVLMSILAEKKNSVWKIVSFHNLDLEMFQDKEIAERSPMPAKVMYANWYKK